MNSNMPDQNVIWNSIISNVSRDNSNLSLFNNHNIVDANDIKKK